MRRFSYVFAIFSALTATAVCKRCYISEMADVDYDYVEDGSKVFPTANATSEVTTASYVEEGKSDYYECPSINYPETYTECCGNKYDMKCCLPLRRFYEIDNRIAMIIAGSVISGCILIAVVVILCCFWSRCPLYNTCRVQYESGGVIIYDKESESIGINGMPTEPSNKNKHVVFTPNNTGYSAV